MTDEEGLEALVGLVKRQNRELDQLAGLGYYAEDEQDMSGSCASDGSVDVVPNEVLARELAATVDALHEERRRVAEMQAQLGSMARKREKNHAAEVAAARNETDAVLARLGRALRQNAELKAELDALRHHLEDQCLDLSRLPLRARRRLRDYVRRFDVDDDASDDGRVPPDRERSSAGGFEEDDETPASRDAPEDDDHDATSARWFRADNGASGRVPARGALDDDVVVSPVIKKKKAAPGVRRHTKKTSTKKEKKTTKKTRRPQRSPKTPPDAGCLSWGTRGEGIYTLRGYAPPLRDPRC